MSLKILVADDSLTIQKVVGITLANSDYELVQSLNESEVFEHLEKDKFDLVLLDFTLSDNKDGYQLAREIKKKSPSVRIMAMLGTFDSVDDNALSGAGVRDKVVKPFDSGQFIKKCKELITLGEDGETLLTSSSDNENTDFGSEWSVDSPELEDHSDLDEEQTTKDTNSIQNTLQDEIEGWGMEVPSIIGSDRPEVRLPPSMGEKEIEVKEQKKTPKLTKIDELALEEEIEEKGREEKSNDWDSVSLSLKTPEISPERDLQLQDEISKEIEADEFWAVDDLGNNTMEFQIETPIEKIEEIVKEEGPDLETDDDKKDELEIEEIKLEEVSSFEDVETESVGVLESSDSKIIVEQIKKSITPMLEDLVKQYTKEMVEKVAWDIIPDLAENIIREEIRNLSKSVTEKNN